MQGKPEIFEILIQMLAAMIAAREGMFWHTRNTRVTLGFE